MSTKVGWNNKQNLFRFVRSFSVSVNDPLPQIKRVEELVDQSGVYISQEKYTDALPLLESSLELYKKHNTDTKSKIICNLYFNLAYTYHHLQNHSLAEDYYKQVVDAFTTVYGDSYRDKGVLLLSYAEWLVSQNRVEEGIEKAANAIQVLRNYHTNDCFIAGALSNYAGYLCAAGRHEEARTSCEEALNIFCNELGKNNGYTRSCFSNMCQIYTKLELNDEISRLEQMWANLDVTTTKGLSKPELEMITEQFLHTVKYAESKFSPFGPTKGPKLYKMQLQSFFQDWEKKGLNLYDPALAPIIEQEVKSIIRGKETLEKWKVHLHKKREEVIQNRKISIDEEIELQTKKESIINARKELKIFNEEKKYTNQLMKQAGFNDSDFLQELDETSGSEEHERKLFKKASKNHEVQSHIFTDTYFTNVLDG